MSNRVLPLLLDARRARKGGPEAVAQRQGMRLAEMVRHARAHSVYYRELYARLPDRVEDSTLLPVTTKRTLMSRFDEWVTDRAVTLDAVRAFIGNPDLIGEQFLGRYTALTTSGTTGVPGIFILDGHNMIVTGILVLRIVREWLGTRDVFRIVTRGGRMTLICATGGHYAEAVAGARLLKQRGEDKVQVLPAHTPMPEMVEQLNRFQPDILAPYASIGTLLAGERIAGRLHISPTLVVLSAEGLSEAGYQRITDAFNTPVRYSYAATECPFISYSCEDGWLHVNSDWVIVEPVDAEYRPTPPGTLSHTVLVSNLANRVQPILRYDLGDRILQRSDPCSCGNGLPAIRVEGRTGDLLTFSTESGEQVSIPALMFEVVDAQEVELFQIVQTAPTTLRVRLRLAPGADAERVWGAAHAEIRHVLERQALAHVRVERAEEPPEQSAGGKYRTVIALAARGVDS